MDLEEDTPTANGVIILLTGYYNRYDKFSICVRFYIIYWKIIRGQMKVSLASVEYIIHI